MRTEVRRSYSVANRLKRLFANRLFVDYSSAFNTILPDILFTKLLELQIPLPTCNWLKSFLTSRPQAVRLSPPHSSTITLSTGSPQGYVLSPLLYALYTNDCSPAHPTPPYKRRRGGDCQHLQVSGHPHLRRPLLDSQHQGPGKEGSAVAVLPACPQEEQSGHEAAAGLLSFLGGECTDVLSGRLVRRLHS